MMEVGRAQAASPSWVGSIRSSESPVSSRTRRTISLGFRMHSDPLMETSVWRAASGPDASGVHEGDGSEVEDDVGSFEDVRADRISEEFARQEVKFARPADNDAVCGGSCLDRECRGHG